MLVLFLVSIFGQIAILRVEQRLDKNYFSNLSGTFSFEALMVFFRLILMLTPFVLFLSISGLNQTAILNYQIEGIYKQDDLNHSRWISQFGREFQLQPLQEINIFIACILSFLTFAIGMFLIMMVYKSLKISTEQVKNRLNDMFQIVTSIVIPALSAFILVKSVN